MSQYIDGLFIADVLQKVHVVFEAKVFDVASGKLRAEERLKVVVFDALSDNDHFVTAFQLNRLVHFRTERTHSHDLPERLLRAQEQVLVRRRVIRVLSEADALS